MTYCNDPKCPDHGRAFRRPQSTAIPGSDWMAVVEICEAADLTNAEKVRRIYRVAAQVLA